MKTTNRSFLYSFLLLLSAAVAAKELCNHEDKKALIHINRTLALPYWSPTGDCCTDWYGVGCDLTTHRVTSFFLQDQNFPTTIPSAIGDLPYLTQLEFRKLPGLTGPIPRSLSKLTNLQFLWLTWNSLTGPVPDYFNRFKDLTYINLSFNNLSGSIPPSLGLAPSLSYLRLDRNRLTGPIPDTLGSSFQDPQTTVYLSHNHLSGPIPKSLGSANITSLDLSRNNLTGDASFLFGESKPLTELDLSRNSLSFDLSEVEAPTGIYLLNLDHNKIYGSLPPSLAGLKNLVYFNVSYNRLCGKIPKVGHFGDVHFDEYSFFHNKCLCGSPLPAACAA